MRSRSSRLFIVLLHLVGVSTNLPQNANYSFWWNVGIVGVHPMAILFESLDLKHAGGLDGFLAQMRAMGYDPDNDVLAEPYWLQDDTDGKCLGPAGFSECGDATLWLVRRRKYTSRRRRSSDNNEDDQNSNKRQRGLLSFLSSFIGDSKESARTHEWGYALQLIDADLLSLSRTSSSENALVELADGRQKHKRKGRREETDEIFGKDCLIPDSSERSNQGVARQSSGATAEEAGDGPSDQSSLRIGPCSSDEAWTWRVNGEGILIQDKAALEVATHRERRKKERGRQVFMGGPIAWQLHRVGSNKRNTPAPEDSAITSGEASYDDCLWRSDSNEAIIAPCTGEMDANTTTLDEPSTAPPRSRTEKSGSTNRVVGFSLVRYQGTASPTPKLPPLPATLTAATDVVNGKLSTSFQSQRDSATTNDESDTLAGGSSLHNPIKTDDKHSSISKDYSDHPPTIVRTSKSHASNPVLHPDIKTSSRLLHTSISQGSNSKPKLQEKKKTTPLSMLRESQPTFFIDESGTPHATAAKVTRSSTISNRDPNNRRLLHKPGSISGDQGHHLLHHPPASSLPPGSPPMHHDNTPHRPRKMPVHPYIESSKDGLWEDPETGLEYLTDLCEYLGHERKEVGRHTLVGVGQYTKTMLKIKVYGVALYLSKRDVLADPNFIPHARSNSDELRKAEDLYNHLMSSPSPSGGRVDRTLLLKMNMQLSTETMRTSLQADWKLLTEEHKEMLIASSFKSRDADEKMLQKIKSEENSSNCSCGQQAPEEYGADPSCCARGTDLVFTWRKSGDLELRIDGRIMDTFTDPGIASGIFYEYLRGDDPMSVDARDHFVDGIPFLLAPLAQVRGVSSPIITHGSTDEIEGSKKKQHTSGYGFVRAIGNVGGMVENVAEAVGNIGEMVTSQAEEAASNFLNAVKTVGSSARGVNSELEKKRILLWDGMVSMPQDTFKFVTSHTPFLKDRFAKESSMSSQLVNPQEWDNSAMNLSHMSSAQRGRIFRPQVARLLGDMKPLPPLTDEIGVIIHPTMNFTHKLFLTMVHFYLVLLLIVSLPGPYNTRTRLVVKRVSDKNSQDESSSKLSCENKKGIFTLTKREGSNVLPEHSTRNSVRIRLEETEETSSAGSVGEWEPSLVEEADENIYAEIRPTDIQYVAPLESTSKQHTEKMKKSLSYFL